MVLEEIVGKEVMELNQDVKTSYKFQIGDVEQLDLWAILPIEDAPDKRTLGGFFQQICALCPAVESCKPHVIVTRNSSVLIMGENRDTEDCTYAQNYISPRYQGRMNVNIE
jgi:hypothetical protein